MDRRKRGTLLTLGGMALAYAGLRWVAGRGAAAPEFEMIPAPPGFRRVRGGQASGGFDPFVGLGGGEAPSEAASLPPVADDPCGALYAGLDIDAVEVPMASFSDYFCPFCRVQTQRLADLADADAGLGIAWHELPLLGDASLAAARAALAAERQGAYARFHAHLMSSPFRPSPAYLARLSEDLGLDHERLLADMDGPDVAADLRSSRALADLFGLAGTPALFIGRTLVVGQVPDATIRRIVALERDGAWRAVCAGA